MADARHDPESFVGLSNQLTGIKKEFATYFKEYNPHLTEAMIANIKIGIWPPRGIPVFPPTQFRPDPSKGQKDINKETQITWQGAKQYPSLLIKTFEIGPPAQGQEVQNHFNLASY